MSIYVVCLEALVTHLLQGQVSSAVLLWPMKTLLRAMPVRKKDGTRLHTYDDIHDTYTGLLCGATFTQGGRFHLLRGLCVQR